MTTTPTIWKPKFTANPFATTGDQSGPQAIGLTNGNILVVWEDTVNGPGAGRDIMGQMFNANGTAIGGSFQVNYTFENQNETNPKIVALPDGGFVVAYSSYNSGIGNFFVVERFNAAGCEVAYNLITNATGKLYPEIMEITADNNGNYIVAFVRFTEAESARVRAIVYSYVSNNPRPEYDAAQNAGDGDDLGNIATFTDGNVITISHEPDGSGIDQYEGVEYKITESGTGNAVGSPVAVAGSQFHDAYAQDVAVLAGGQFVVLYEYYSPYARHFALRIGSGDAPGHTLGPEIFVGHPESSSDRDAARVVALRDGGFLVVWADSGTIADQIYATRYTVNGTVIGAENFVVATGLAHEPAGSATILLGRLHLTSDGRVLVPFHNSAGEISLVILDPREVVISGTANSEGLTAQTTSSFLFGLGGDDTLYGQGGNDELNGGTGVDTLRGGAGNDIYFLADVNKIDPNLNLWFYDSVIEAANEGIDTIHVTYVPNAKSTYVLPANVENGVIDGTDPMNLTGNELNNRLTGNKAANTLDGGAGIDTAVFSGPRSAYTITRIGVTLQVAGPDGTDTLTKIERLAFSDGTIPSGLQQQQQPQNDLNGDSRSDILWHTDSGFVGVWQMNGSTIGSASGIAPAPAGGHVAGIGDLNDDGMADIVWWTDGGFVGTWLMNGNAILASPGIGPAPAGGHIAGIADVSGDGRADIVWTTDSGFVGIWMMNGGTVLSAPGIGPTPAGGHVAGLGDFNADGYNDILWIDDSRFVGMWELNGSTILASPGIAPAPAGGHVAGIGDFNADGMSDILWLTDSGFVGLWEMNGTSILASPGVGLAPAGAHVAEVADLNGDGKADIVWQDASGFVGTWLMDGAVISSSPGIAAGPAGGHIVPDYHLV